MGDTALPVTTKSCKTSCSSNRYSTHTHTQRCSMLFRGVVSLGLQFLVVVMMMETKVVVQLFPLVLLLELWFGMWKSNFLFNHYHGWFSLFPLSQVTHWRECVLIYCIVRSYVWLYNLYPIWFGSNSSSGSALDSWDIFDVSFKPQTCFPFSFLFLTLALRPKPSGRSSIE